MDILCILQGVTIMALTGIIIYIVSRTFDHLLTKLEDKRRANMAMNMIGKAGRDFSELSIETVTRINDRLFEQYSKEEDER